MYKQINEKLFDNTLLGAVIEVLDLNHSDRPRYRRLRYIFYGRFVYISEWGEEHIWFSYNLEDEIKKKPTQKAQVECLAEIMLHEMIHQYCFEYEIDDDDHSDEWQRIAEQHGLHSYYEFGDCIEEWLKDNALDAIKDFRIR